MKRTEVIKKVAKKYISPKSSNLVAKKVDIEALDRAIRSASPILKRMNKELKIEEYGLQSTQR
jgi:hypothetical protein